MLKCVSANWFISFLQTTAKTEQQKRSYDKELDDEVQALTGVFEETIQCDFQNDRIAELGHTTKKRIRAKLKNFKQNCGSRWVWLPCLSLVRHRPHFSRTLRLGRNANRAMFSPPHRNVGGRGNFSSHREEVRK